MTQPLKLRLIHGEKRDEPESPNCLNYPVYTPWGGTVESKPITLEALKRAMFRAWHGLAVAVVPDSGPSKEDET